MNNAIWLLTATPKWFFFTVMNPLADGYVSAIPALGVCFLAVGVILSVIVWRRQLLLFLIPLALSVGVIGAAGYLRGQYTDMTLVEPGLLGFVSLQALLAVLFAYKARAAWLPGAALAVFSVSHALFVAKIATMALTDSWA